MYAQDLESLKTSTQQENWMLKMGNEANRLLFNGQLKNFHFSLLSMRGRRKLGSYFPALGWIKMNPRYFFSNNNKVAIHVTFVHELCHKACNEIEKARQFESAHGYAWSQWMKRVGLPANRCNQHKLDIDTPAERAMKQNRLTAVKSTGAQELTVRDLQPKRLVKFFHKNSWIVGQLIRPIGGGVRWGVASSRAVGMWRVPTSLLFGLSPEEQTLHAPTFADDTIYNHVVQLSVPRRRIFRYRRGRY
jgi:predicted SprT family Zn-dependent metalloprotease